MPQFGHGSHGHNHGGGRFYDGGHTTVIEPEYVGDYDGNTTTIIEEERGWGFGRETEIITTDLLLSMRMLLEQHIADRYGDTTIIENDPGFMGFGGETTSKLHYITP
ncbi:hypothetical protein BC936DRAFT_144265 [Jimgerdemannia flammicorona]|uniref:Uncharacterized protein n=1 Tax=Jimgerdemannia flammicorona TaxID=994334 RepID=A0A433DM33_9FUNG|nr:hypothetical protein BC936DRAFT_144265 [Jimgerdemannia flammicorona]